ncbi:type VI secretion system-associated protein TagF [Parasulfitobacter algicola]|uniref:Type VI secretion system-associated protein TagF n=1 Tax=Parasulfitobacter algicola TaxID=2614809 RepID=A0ABX2IP24_9RHOB|nr:type VI secretion system-associated protein TagF [Sulfitobacter algicola]NSX53726.1 type VI secretion system-associated protein TagF [Sulfitobacter algicola]
MAENNGRHSGYFGKIPTHGDFVSNYMDRSFITRLDDWLQACIRESQSQLEDGWLDAYLVSPVWRIAFPAKVWGPLPVLAVMMPSVDRVGRYFPLVLTTTLPQPKITAKRLRSADYWFNQAERLVLSTLEQDFSLPAFDAAAQQLSPPSTYKIIDDQPYEPGEDPLSVSWWTKDTIRRPIITPGLPKPEEFKKFLARPAEQKPLVAEVKAPVAEDTPVETNPDQPASVSLDLAYGASSTRGAMSRINADGWYVSDNKQLSMVVGGQGDMPINASVAKTINDMMATVDKSFSMNELVAETQELLRRSHDLLRSQNLPNRPSPASSVAVLLIQEQRYSLLWAGDVRAYLLRDGELHRLSRDHSDTKMPVVLTRSIGGANKFELDSAIGHVRDGDKFLLCSAGVHKALTENDIRETLFNEATPDKTATVLTQDAVIGGGSLDATALAMFLSAKT